MKMVIQNAKIAEMMLVLSRMLLSNTQYIDIHMEQRDGQKDVITFLPSSPNNKQDMQIQTEL